MTLDYIVARPPLVLSAPGVQVRAAVPANMNGGRLTDELRDALDADVDVVFAPETRGLVISGVPPGRAVDVQRLVAQHKGGDPEREAEQARRNELRQLLSQLETEEARAPGRDPLRRAIILTGRLTVGLP